jgi:DNA-binding transcriptional MerR regulator
MDEDAAAGGARLWRIGELADATGVTVRALHHYERLGLVCPSTRTSGGHRLYDEQSVRALYRVRALRDLGLSLTEVGDVLGSAGTRLSDLLIEHLGRVDDQIEQLEELRERLRTARRQVDDVAGAEGLLAIIEAMNRVSGHAAKRGSGTRATAVSAESEVRWRRAGQELRCLMDAGVRPSDRRVTAVAARIAEDIRSFAADDPAVLAALAHLRRAGAEFELAGWDRTLLLYLDRALAPVD